MRGRVAVLRVGSVRYVHFYTNTRWTRCNNTFKRTVNMLNSFLWSFICVCAWAFSCEYYVVCVCMCAWNWKCVNQITRVPHFTGNSRIAFTSYAFDGSHMSVSSLSRESRVASTEFGSNLFFPVFRVCCVCKHLIELYDKFISFMSVNLCGEIYENKLWTVDGERALFYQINVYKYFE